MERAKRSNRGKRQSAPRPAPRIGRKDLQDPDRDVTEPVRPAPDDEQRQAIAMGVTGCAVRVRDRGAAPAIGLWCPSVSS